MKKISERIIIDNGYKKITSHEYSSPGRENSDFLIYENSLYPDASMVLARTLNGKFLLIDEYRYGVEAFMISMIAGGQNKEESPLDAAIRELHEETGYGGGKGMFLGKFVHNYYIRGYLHYYFLYDVIPVGEQNLDTSEKIEIRMFEQEALETAIRDNTIICPYTVSAYYLAKEKTRNFTHFEF